MTTMPNRPQPRPRVRPASDEAIDPIRSSRSAFSTLVDEQLPPVAPAEAPRRGPEPAVQLNVRVSLTVSNKLEQDMATTGKTKKALVEEAILAYRAR